jgi:hypothetical protein
MDGMDILEGVVLGEKARAFESELKALEELGCDTSVEQWDRRSRLKRARTGGWTTLPDGRKAMLWAFHAFAPPALTVDYRKPCRLVHLGLYNLNDRSLDASEAPPPLPRDAKDWPWA